MPNFYECTSDFERILEAQGAFVCLPLGGEPVLADRAAGAATWCMVALAGGGSATLPSVPREGRVAPVLPGPASTRSGGFPPAGPGWPRWR